MKLVLKHKIDQINKSAVNRTKLLFIFQNKNIAETSIVTEFQSAIN